MGNYDLKQQSPTLLALQTSKMVGGWERREDGSMKAVAEHARTHSTICTSSGHSRKWSCIHEQACPPLVQPSSKRTGHGWGLGSSDLKGCKTYSDAIVTANNHEMNGHK